MVLLGGLSVDSRFMMSYSQDGKAGMVTDPAAAEGVLRQWAGK